MTIAEDLAQEYAKQVEEKGLKVLDLNYLTTVISKLTRWITSTDPQVSRSLMVVGPVGSGKTTMVSAMREVLRRHYVTVASTTCREVSERLKGGDDLYELASSHEIMIFDDLGTDEPTVTVYGTVFRPMERAIKKASDSGKSLVITTNLSLDGIMAQYGSERMADCLRAYAVLDMSHVSFRRI